MASQAEVDLLPALPATASKRSDSEILAVAQRRRFTREYKLRILREADRCRQPGEMGTLLHRRVVLDPATTKGGRKGEVFLPARLITKFRRFLVWKRRAGQSLEPDAPMFIFSQRRRLSPRAAQWRFAWWQRRAGFDRRYGFHHLRHAAVTAVYRMTRDLFLAQRFARHASPLTTIVYTHPADDELYKGIRDLPC